MKILIKFMHGLGDAVQLTCVLQHLKWVNGWDVDVQSLYGKHSALRGVCTHSYHEREPTPDYEFVYDLAWWECDKIYEDSPSTKAARCLRDVFSIQPNEQFMRYQVSPSLLAQTVAQDYLQRIGCQLVGDTTKFNSVLIHYQGNTSQDKKDLHVDEIYPLVQNLQATGYVPIILDWDKRSALPDNKTVFCPAPGLGDIWGNFGSGDAETIVALASLSSLCVGIDSGPQKCFGCTDTPTLAVWKEHHPIHFYDLADNVLHLIPEDHSRFARGSNLSYFLNHYRHVPYLKHLRENIIGNAFNLLEGKA